jgi:hypothetical protein
MIIDPRIERMRAALPASWSAATSSLWTLASPARGQCSVTALDVQELLGGEILKTRVGDAWHFYNRIDGNIVDFTAEQFEDPPDYLDLAATRAEALADTTPARYEELLRALRVRGFDASGNPGLAPGPTRD